MSSEPLPITNLTMSPSRNTPYSIDWENPEHMLRRIESEPKAFREGRRNDDMVNWFLTMLLCGPGRTLGSILDRFNGLMTSLDKEQQQALRFWEMGTEHKIRKLYQYYGTLTDQRAIMHYWIPVGYSHLNEVAEGQLELLKGV